MKYKCIEGFEVPKLEEPDSPEIIGEFSVHTDSIWELETALEDNDTEVYLTKEDGSWLNINRELFDLMFEQEGE
jgi:hypothetical protein